MMSTIFEEKQLEIVIVWYLDISSVNNSSIIKMSMTSSVIISEIIVG